jgi:hypothetical protein
MASGWFCGNFSFIETDGRRDAGAPKPVNDKSVASTNTYIKLGIYTNFFVDLFLV